MGFDMVLKIIVDHPIVAIPSILFGGGILCGFFGGLLENDFLKDFAFILIALGIILLILLIVFELIYREREREWERF